MSRGFYTILAAQFFSALADNALLFAAIALLSSLHAADWQTYVLQQFFVFAYIILAPFVGRRGFSGGTSASCTSGDSTRVTTARPGAD